MTCGPTLLPATLILLRAKPEKLGRRNITAGICDVEYRESCAAKPTYMKDAKE